MEGILLGQISDNGRRDFPRAGIGCGLCVAVSPARLPGAG